jgi:tripartite-type tricarboxylate transporter receptor subunit TctC
MTARAPTAAFFLALGCSSLACAQAYPAKPVRLIMPYPAGGAVDIVGRLIAQQLSKPLGQQVVVDNRPGASALLGTQSAAKALPDGYTLLMATSTNAINQTLHPALPYDLDKDFEPVALAAKLAQILVVHPSVPARSVRDFVALAKAKPMALNYGSPGSGSAGHIAMAVLARRAGIQLVHVPYKGGAPALSDVLGGQITGMFSNIVTAIPHIKTGRLNALAISSAQRSVLAPQVPTVAEAGYPRYEVISWHGVLAPASTPAEIVARLNDEITRILRLPDVQQRLLAIGAEPQPDVTQAQFRDFIRSDVAHWARMMEETGVRPE